MSKIGDFLASEKKITDDALRWFFGEEKKKAGLVDDELVYLMETIEKMMLRGGKRARALLVRLAYGLVEGAETEKIVKASLYVELMHLYILVHDDITDRDLKRYGGETLEVLYGKRFMRLYGKENEHFGQSVAMVAGDLIQTMAHSVLVDSGFEAELIVEIERVMAQTLKEVVTGWYLHQLQNHQSLGKAREERYLAGMKLVSASYSFEAPLMIGLVLGRADNKTKKVIKNYAYHVGMAFQMQDDILGVFGKTKETGKPVGNDIREGKKTLLVLRAYQEIGRKEKEFMAETVGKEMSDKSLKKMQQLIRESGSLEYSQNMARKHIKQAKLELENLERVEKKRLESFVGLADFVLERKY
ncbi:polyprenyl synthetase family protein [Pseudomonadota bacterium]